MAAQAASHSAHAGECDARRPRTQAFTLQCAMRLNADMRDTEVGEAIEEDVDEFVGLAVRPCGAVRATSQPLRM